MAHKRFYLFYGCIISISILILLFFIKINCPALLDIDLKWLIIAGLPIVIALIVGGYIKKFSGFGIDIEMIVKEPLMDNPTILEIVQSFKVLRKDSLSYLEQLTENEKNSYNVLLFNYDNRDYYNVYVVRKYLGELKGIKFFEMVNARGEFISLTKIDRTEILNDNDNMFIKTFIDQVDERAANIDDSKTTSVYIGSNETIINALQIIKDSGKDFIAVLNNERILKGVVYLRKLEEYITNAVLRSFKEN